MTLNRDLFVKDPLQTHLLNNGVARVSDIGEETLRYEMQTFVCEGEYEKGLARILQTFLDNIKQPSQPAVWVSGFYGSGKSHLVKLLRFLWTDYLFSDGATARGVTNLTREISDLLRELETQGKRLGGLKAAGGTLGAGAGESVRLSLLRIVFEAVGLPVEYPAARFVLWLRRERYFDTFRKEIERAGKDLGQELRNMHVSPHVARAILKSSPSFANSEKEVRLILLNQFPLVQDVSNNEMVSAIEEALTTEKTFPLTLIALDEVQQYIGENADRTYRVQEVTEECSKHFKGRLLFVATGQSALVDTPHLQKLRDRFTIPIQLSDTDVEEVIRKLVLAKKQNMVPEVQSTVDYHSGEISRHLVQTKIGPVPEDREYLVQDYPILPVRRRFWEKVLRAVDRAGTAAQLRTQLRIVFEAVRENGEKDLGCVVPGDFIFDQVRTDLLQTGVLLREIAEIIEKQKDGTKEGELRARLCALIFLIGRLPTERGADIGLKATPDNLADLLVEDLRQGSAEVRKRIPELLKGLVESAHLMQIDSEYRLQTRESSAWEADFRERRAKILNNLQKIASERADLIRNEVGERLKGIKPVQGKSKVPRTASIHYGPNKPEDGGNCVPIWIRDGWDVDEKTVLSDAREGGNDSPVVFVHIPVRSADELKRAIADHAAAKETLQVRGVPTTDPGIEARQAMETRLQAAEHTVDALLGDIISSARVFQGGGGEISGHTLIDRIVEAVNSSLIRLFPEFNDADDDRWRRVFEQAKKGNENALEALGYKGDVERHPVCSAILRSIGSGKKGREVREQFTSSSYGWPQDAIDGALACLLATGHLKSSHNGSPIEAQDLDQQKIKVTDFRIEHVTLSAIERVKIRSVFKEAGIDCKSGEEGTVVSTFLHRLREDAAEAGGDPPLPARPSLQLVDEIASLSGNEQLKRIFDEQDRMTQLIKDLDTKRELAKDRLPQWENLLSLLDHAQSLAGCEEVRNQVESIRSQRSLLASSDPIPDLIGKLAQCLRNSLTDAHRASRSEYERQLGSLEVSEAWQKLDTAKRAAILSDCSLAGVPEIKVGTPKEILETLNQRPLDWWSTFSEALPQRFQNAREMAAKAVEPKARRINLGSATIHDERELDQWLEATRKEVLQRLKDGPVII